MAVGPPLGVVAPARAAQRRDLLLHELARRGQAGHRAHGQEPFPERRGDPLGGQDELLRRLDARRIDHPQALRR